jgi:hydroxymethylcytosylglucuronate/cytosylglucuronate synthase
MSDERKLFLLGAIGNFGWGPLGKFRLILDELPGALVALYGTSARTGLTKELLASRCEFSEHQPQQSSVAVVINDPPAANSIGDLGVPVVYVDSLPYLWTRDAEVPARDKVAYYCAQRFPTELLPIASPLRHWQDIHWIDPIVPTSHSRRGGQGIVINFGGLQSPLVGNPVDAYLSLVLFPLIDVLKVSGRKILAVCGNLSTDTCRRLRALLPECHSIGPQPPYTFERTLNDADLLITSPGSTTILQAMSIKLPTLLLPPQNLSQFFNGQFYSKSGANNMQWPAGVLDFARVEQLRPQGQPAVHAYIYQSIADAAASPQAADEVKTVIRKAVHDAPADGVLNDCLSTLGSEGAYQVAQLIKQAVFAPIAHRGLKAPTSV